MIAPSALRALAQQALDQPGMPSTMFVRPQTILALLDAVEAARHVEFALDTMLEDGEPATFSANVEITRARFRAALASFTETQT